jgi:hypothetical protein
MAEKIITEVQEIQRSYNETIQIVDGLPFKQKDVIRMIEFYSNSKYLTAQKDELGRDKPFYQILNGMCDVENAAKDLDTKDISATSDDGQHYVESFLLTKDIYEWMKETNFALTLNEMRNTHTRYGSLLAKRCIYEEDGKKVLRIEVPEWKNVITDQLNILDLVIEVHYMTPAELLGKMDVWDEEGIRKVVKRASKNLRRRIPVLEVRGEFPVAYYVEMEGEKPTDEEKTTFSYQLYHFAGEESEHGNDIGRLTSNLTPLYWENDTERVYKYLARKRKAGRGFGVGVFEEGEEAQVWTNDTVIKQARAMELSTKVIGQSASKKLKNRNLLNEVDNGQILEYDENRPITTVPLVPSGGLNQFPNLIQQWYNQLEKTTSGYAAQRGETPPSGTPFRLQATVLQQSSSVFTDLQEEFGIFVTEILNDWVMPHLAKQLNKEHILSHEFSPEELKEIDKTFATREANRRSLERIFNGEMVTPERYKQFEDEAQSIIGKTKAQRFLKIPKDYYKGFKSKLTVNITGEQRNKAATLESLFSIMTVYAQNPQLVQDPVLMQIFLRILELSGAGISPVAIAGAVQQQAERAKEMAAAAPPTEEPAAPPDVGMSLEAKGGIIPR